MIERRWQVGDVQGKKGTAHWVPLWGSNLAQEGRREDVVLPNSETEVFEKMEEQTTELTRNTKDLEFGEEKGPVHSIERFCEVDEGDVGSFLVVKPCSGNMVE